MPNLLQISQATAILDKGGLVAFPTETVYGLGADAENPTAVAAIYTAKGRPANHPVIVHLSPEADLNYWAKQIPDEANKLIAAFWPGPLTLILKRAFKGGQGGIAAPSANKFGRVSPTTAQHVRDEFEVELQPGGLIGMVLEGEQSEVGIESTILDLSRLTSHGPVLLRPGHISAQQLAVVLGSMPGLPTADATTPRASGTLEAHYAPQTPVVIVKTDQMEQVLRQLQAARKKVALLHYDPLSTTVIAPICLSHNAAQYAYELYASLRVLDNADADVIVVQEPPDAGEWHGVQDRLRRAAHDSQGVLAKLLTQD